MQLTAARRSSPYFADHLKVQVLDFAAKKNKSKDEKGERRWEEIRGKKREQAEKKENERASGESNSATLVS